MCHIFFIYSSVDRHLGCFHVLAIVNSGAVNIGVHVSFWIRVLSRYGIWIFFFNAQQVWGFYKGPDFQPKGQPHICCFRPNTLKSQQGLSLGSQSSLLCSDSLLLWISWAPPQSPSPEKTANNLFMQHHYADDLAVLSNPLSEFLPRLPVSLSQ